MRRGDRALVSGAPGAPLFFMVDEPQPGFRSWDKEAAAQPTTPIADEIAGYDMLYSSGTTGRPKGIKRESENKPIDVPNPLLRLLCADMCGMAPTASICRRRRSITRLRCAST